MKRKISPSKQALMTNSDEFMNPLSQPGIKDIISQSGIDKPNTKLTIEKIIRIYFLSMVFKEPYKSLNGMASLKKNLFCPLFVGLSQWPKQTLSDANQRISFSVFRDIYEQLSSEFNCSFSKEKVDSKFGNLKIFDSTHLMLCLKLMPWGSPQNQRKSRGQMKVTMRIDDGLFVPNKIVFDGSFRNDNTFFGDMIDWKEKGFTYLFDRGFINTKKFLGIHYSQNYFISRLHKGTSYTVKKNLLFEKMKKDNVEIINDQVVSLGKNKNETPALFRLVTVIVQEDEGPKTLYFITNRFDLDPFEVAEIYRKRWQIELFFRWLKSGLKINRFFSYSENGVFIQIYVTLIFNLLLALYHKNRNLKQQMGINTQREIFNELLNYIILWAFSEGALQHKYYQNKNQLIL